MTSLIIKDLAANHELDSNAMAAVRGGLTAVINNSQTANQIVTGGNGPIYAVNAPISSPSTVLTESNPFTMVDMNTINLINSFQNGISI